MLTETEESELEFILEDLRRKFLLSIHEDDYDFIEASVYFTQKALQRLKKDIVSRKVRGR